MSSFQEAIDRDLAKCRAKQGHRNIWTIAADNNKRERWLSLNK